MARNDRGPGSREKGLSVKRVIVSHSAVIKANKGERIQYTVASVGRQSARDKAAKRGIINYKTKRKQQQQKKSTSTLKVNEGRI